MTTETSRHSPAFWPLLLSGLILLLCIGAIWLVWSRHAPDSAAYAAQERKLAELAAKRDSLRETLALSPCAAREKLAVPTPTASPGAANTGSAAPASGANAAKLENIESACVFVVSPAGNKGLSTGSGFFVAPGYVLTNRHVVEQGDNKVLVTSKSLGRPAKASIVATSRDKNADYALLKVNLPANAHPGVLVFAPAAQKTEKVGAWGFPTLVNKADPAYARLLRGEDVTAVPELSYSEGVISAVLDRKPQFIVHTAPISPGNSGGPLINEAGKVVGINTMITLDEGSYRQASIALAARDILAFLAQNGLKLQ